jgi:hypothetical protein
LPLEIEIGTIKLSTTYPGFSDRDYRAALVDGERMSLVTNGGEAFAIIRTDQTPSADRFSDADFADWKRRYATAFHEAMCVMASELAHRELSAPSTVRGPRRTKALYVKLQAVNDYLCGLLHYGFYAGTWGRPLELIYQPR